MIYLYLFCNILSLQDNGGLSAETTLTIIIQDVDDLYPTFMPSCGERCTTVYRVDTDGGYIVGSSLSKI